MNSNSHNRITFLVTFRRNLKRQYFLLRNIICHFLLSKCCLRSLKLLAWGKNNHNWGRIVPPQEKHRDKRKTILVSVMPRPGQDARWECENHSIENKHLDKNKWRPDRDVNYGIQMKNSLLKRYIANMSFFFVKLRSRSGQFKFGLWTFSFLYKTRGTLSGVHITRLSPNFKSQLNQHNPNALTW